MYRKPLPFFRCSIGLINLIGHGWKLDEDNSINWGWTSDFIFLQVFVLVDIMCAGLGNGTTYDDDAGMSTKVDCMVDKVYQKAE